MSRKLKAYQTSLGFFDLAIAAPSMKAALEAWGADGNLFHQGAARESDDPKVVAATMARPGVVLKRTVGTNGPFGERAELPTDLGRGNKPVKVARKSAARKPEKWSNRPPDQAAERRAALAYEQEEKRRKRERATEEGAARKERERRQRAVEKVQEALNEAERKHLERAAAIGAEREAVEAKSQAEDERWNTERKRLQI